MIHDISQPLGPATAVWPGDRPVRLEWTMRRDAGDSVNVAGLELSVHAGTHADGPLHVTDDGAGAGDLALAPFVGPAIVVDAVGHTALEPELLDGVDLQATPRVLFRTRTTVDPAVFPDRVAPVTMALARALATGGAVLVGTDAPSVDPLDSKTLDAHRALVAGGLAIVENLALDEVEPGPYTLMALPLKLKSADSSPVRAVLLTP